jgi:hypothetical protein
LERQEEEEEEEEEKEEEEDDDDDCKSCMEVNTTCIKNERYTVKS